jgi:hypothetical protein
MLKYVLLSCAIFFLTVQGGYVFEKCKNNAPIPLDMNVTDCDQTPCDVPVGSTVEMFMDFMLPYPTTTLDVSLEIWWGKFKVPFELTEDEKNGCAHVIGGKCPLPANQVLHYRFETVVDAPMTGIIVDLIYKFTDDQKRTALCFKTQSRVVPPEL